MGDDELLKRRSRVLSPAYRLFYDEPLHIVRGEGVLLWDADGREYLDCYNNVASVGHCHPRVVEALSQQAGRLNTHTRYLHENAVRYAERLVQTLPDGLDVVTFTCSGSEANDLACRMAQAATGQAGVVAVDFAYHGTTQAVFGFSPEECPEDERPGWVATVPAPDSRRPETIRDEHVAGAAAELNDRGFEPAMFICDTAFSTNGVLTPPPEWLERAFANIRKAGGLAVADEVQAGLCRLGDHTWGFEDAGVVPDIVVMGKPLGNGYPLAAVVTTEEVANAFAERHGYFNTFAGSPVATAVGNAVLDVIEEEDILRNVNETGTYLGKGLREIAERCEVIADVRGKGLFWGLELDDPELARAARERLRRAGVLLGVTGPGANVLKVRPPLVFEKNHADRLLDALENVLR